MVEKTEVEKLRILLPHWIEHNQSHEAEFKKWAAAARHEGKEEVSTLIEQAVASMDSANHALTEALAKVGGGKEGEGHHHHHH